METESTGIQFTKATYATAGYYVDLQGCRLAQRPSAKGIYIHCTGNDSEKVIIR